MDHPADQSLSFTKIVINETLTINKNDFINNEHKRSFTCNDSLVMQIPKTAISPDENCEILMK